MFRQFVAKTRENVYNARRHVRGMQYFGKADRAQGHLFRCQHHTGITANDDRRNIGYQSK